MLEAIIVILMISCWIYFDYSDRQEKKNPPPPPCQINVTPDAIEIAVDPTLVRRGLNFIIIDILDTTASDEINFILTKNDNLKSTDSDRVCKYLAIDHLKESTSDTPHTPVFTVNFKDLIPVTSGPKKLTLNVNFYDGFKGEKHALHLRELNSELIYSEEIEYDFKCLGYWDNEPELRERITKEIAQFMRHGVKKGYIDESTLIKTINKK